MDGVPTSTLDDARLTALRRAKVGFIFQSFQLLHTLTVVENVELPLLLAGGRDVRDRALERLEWVELGGLAGRLPHQLSGGQMQRVAIARALANDPRLLLADEPTGNLDTTTGGHILELLGRINRNRGTTTVMATHSAEAAAIASRVVRMRDGRDPARRPLDARGRRQGRRPPGMKHVPPAAVPSPRSCEHFCATVCVHRWPSLTVALGVGVVLAIELAGEAAAARSARPSRRLPVARISRWRRWAAFPARPSAASHGCRTRWSWSRASRPSSRCRASRAAFILVGVDCSLPCRRRSARTWPRPGGDGREPRGDRLLVPWALGREPARRSTC